MSDKCQSLTAATVNDWLQYQAQPSASLYHGLLKHAKNDCNTISCTVPIFHGNDVVPFPGIWEQNMTGIPGCPGNGSPGMQTLSASDLSGLSCSPFCMYHCLMSVVHAARMDSPADVLSAPIACLLRDTDLELDSQRNKEFSVSALSVR